MLRALLAGIAGAWLAVVLWGGVSGDLVIMTVHASIHPAIHGETTLAFPPLGSVTAATHSGPTRIEFRIDQVHIEETAEWLKQRKSPQQTANLVESGVRRIAWGLARLSVLVAALGAIVACALLKTGGRGAVWGTAAGMLSVVVPLALAAGTFNPTAFETPEYSGEMARAPHLLNVAQQAWRTNSGLVQEIPRVAARTAALCRRLEYAGYQRFAAPKSEYCVLAISDLHNNPAGVRFALDLARTYKANLVICAGDFTDLGHPLEAQLLAGLKSFGLPIVTVTGNHDSRATVKALRSVPELTVLDDGRVAECGGLRIMGFGDPSAHRAGAGSVNTSRRQLRSLSHAISRRLRRVRTPDILLVHNNRVGREMAGRVPIVIDGHLHASSMGSRRGTVVVNPGTTGAAGIRFFSAKDRPSFSAAVLHFTLRRPRTLRRVDSIRIELPSGDFAVTRKTMTPDM